MGGDVRHDFGARIRVLRRERGLTQEALAQRSSLSVEAVGRIERGAFSPTLETIHKLASGLGVPFQELFKSPQSEMPSSGRRAHVCQYVARLEGPQRRAVWDVLLSLFGTPRARDEGTEGSVEP